MTKYSFGWKEDAVEIPELDAFLADLQETFKRHGVGIWLTQDYGYENDSPTLKLIPYTPTDFWDLFANDLIDNLSEAGPVPFLVKARSASEARRVEREEVVRRRDDAVRAKANQTRERNLKEKGIQLSDGTYRLVKDHD